MQYSPHDIFAGQHDRAVIWRTLHYMSLAFQSKCHTYLIESVIHDEVVCQYQYHKRHLIQWRIQVFCRLGGGGGGALF